MRQRPLLAGGCHEDQQDAAGAVVGPGPGPGLERQVQTRAAGCSTGGLTFDL